MDAVTLNMHEERLHEIRSELEDAEDEARALRRTADALTPGKAPPLAQAKAVVELRKAAAALARARLLLLNGKDPPPEGAARPSPDEVVRCLLEHHAALAYVLAGEPLPRKETQEKLDRAGDVIRRWTQLA